MSVNGLDSILKDKRRHSVDRDVYVGAQSLSRVEAPLDYHREKWDFAVAERGGYVRLFKLDDGEYSAIETNWRNPLEAGPIVKQKADLIRAWTKSAKRNKDIRLCAPPFSEKNFIECKSDADLAANLGRGGYKRGTAYFIDDMCYIATGNTPDDDWLMYKGRKMRGHTPIVAALLEGGADFIIDASQTFRASEAMARNEGRTV